MTVIAGVDVGNATTEVVLVSDGKILGAGRVPTRGRKGSADSLRGAAALIRRVERQAGCRVDEARIAPLRAVDTSVLTIPGVPPSAGRLRVLAAGVPTPGGTGVCVGSPQLLTEAAGFRSVAATLAATGPRSVAAAPQAAKGSAIVAVVPAGLRFDEAAAQLRELLASGVPVGAVLVAGDEGVLVANRVDSSLPVIDQVDAAAAAACELLAVEVRPPGHSLGLLTDPVALGAEFGLDETEAGFAAALCRTLADYPNAVVGLNPQALRGVRGVVPPRANGASAVPPAMPEEPWVLTGEGSRVSLRAACAQLAEWAPGTVRAFGSSAGETEVDDLFAVDLAAAAEAATARQGSMGRAVLVASLARIPVQSGPADMLADLLSLPVRSPVSEPGAARLGALTTPGARADAVVVDLGAGTIDVIGTGADIVAAGAGELLTAAVAETLGISRAAADWVKRGPCVRVDGGQRYEAEDGSRGFLDIAAPAAAVGMLAVSGPGGWLPFDRRHGPGEWRAIRLRIKHAVLSANLRRTMRALELDPRQVLIVGGPAGDEELLGVIARSLPDGVAIGRGNVGGSCGPEPLGHRYAVALGLAIAG
jgi:hypothetical protein